MAKPSHQPHACQACGVTFSRLHTVKQHWQKKLKTRDSQHQGDFQAGFAVPIQVNDADADDHDDDDDDEGQETNEADEGQEDDKAKASPEAEEVNASHGFDDSNYDDGAVVADGYRFDLNPLSSRPIHQYPEPEEITWSWSASELSRGPMLSPPAKISRKDVVEPRSDKHQLRSSRTTRNQDPNSTAARNRAGVIDYDPTEGLPVRKWERVSTKVRQDNSNDANGAANEDTIITEQNILSELPLPSFYNQLPPHSQMLLRAARMPNRNVKLSVWNKEKESWERPDEGDSQSDKLKSRHLLDPETSQSPSSGHEDDADKGNEEDGDRFPGGVKKRKTTSGVKGGDIDEKYYEVMKWTQVPLATAEKTEERKYLADRRPGMSSLYGGAYQQTNGYGVIGVSGPEAMNATTGTGFDLGDGSGLGNAAGVLSGPGQNGLAGGFGQPGTPVRKNMPPRRKKKKLGGPGRKKAVPVPAPSEVVTGDVTMADATDAAQEVPSSREVTGETKVEADNLEGEQDEEGEDFSGSDSDGEDEGSEEGEIEEHHDIEGAAPPKESGFSAKDSPESNLSPPPQEIQNVIQEAQMQELPTKDEDTIHSPLPSSPEPKTESTPIEIRLVGAEQVKEVEVIPEVEPTPQESTPEPPVSTEMKSEPAVEPHPESQHEEATSITKPTTNPSEETDLLGDLEAAVNGMEQPE